MWMYRLKDMIPGARDIRIEFKTQVPKRLECANCGCVPSVLWRAVCLHGFCQDCKELLDTCGMLVCSHDFSETDVDELEEDESAFGAIKDLEAKCLWSPSGCPFVGPVKDLGDHLNGCSYHLLECSKCRRKLSKNQIESHAKQCSPTNLTPARKCTPPTPKSAARPTLKVLCSLKSVGCQYQGSREEVNRHETFQNHIPLLLQFAQDTNEAIKSLQENTSILREDRDMLAQKLNIAQEEIQRLKRKDEDNRRAVMELQLKVLRNERTLTDNCCSTQAVCCPDPAPRGFFHWRIQGYAEVKMKAASGEETVLYSRPFYSAIPGYRLRLVAHPNGSSSVSKNHFSVFFQILKGSYDHLVPWPFREKVRLRISDQSGNGKHKDYISTISTTTATDKPETRKPFQKPKTENNVPIGSAKMLPLKDLENQLNGFLRNDAVEVILELI